MTRVPSLSKSRYISGDQCRLRLWYDTYARDLATEPDDTLNAIFATGHEVGKMACRRYPDGHLVAHDHRHTSDALAETRQLIERGLYGELDRTAYYRAKTHDLRGAADPSDRRDAHTLP